MNFCRLNFCQLLVLGILFSFSTAFAFPELVRHGYSNCTTCHVSPTGGGLITEYGRALSKEVLSTWARDGEEGVLHGLIDTSSFQSWLNVGGDIRSVQTLRETNAVKEARLIFMQGDVETALSIGRMVFDGTIGQIYKGRGLYEWGSRRYFALYKISDEFSVRVGRFFAAYGLNVPDHNINVRKGFASLTQGLSFNEGMETNNVEASYIGEKWNGYLTGVQSPREFVESQRETALAAQLAYGFLDSYKVGVSLWHGTSETMQRSMGALHGILGVSKKLYVLTEQDLVWSRLTSPERNQRSYLRYTKLGYEFIQGIHGILTEEYSRVDLNSNDARDAYGVGFMFYPRPHFELQGLWQRVREQPAAPEFYDYAFLMGHYYF